MTVGRSISIMTIAALAVGAMALWASPSFAEKGRAIPTPVVDEAATAAPASEVAVLAGGCFWGVQGVFQHVDGVTGAVSGYAGGGGDSANYEKVSTGTTGHAESVRITFDPRRISYGRLLQIYFAVAHDPTELNRQGPDRVSLSDFSHYSGADKDRQNLYRATGSVEFLPAGNHDPDRAWTAVLSGRGVPSGLPKPAPVAAVHRDQRSAEDQRIETAVP